MSWDRRQFLEFSGGLFAAAAMPSVAAAQDTPEYWAEIRRQFDLDETFVNLNNGNSSPSPRVVHEAYTRYLASSNRLPVHHRGLLEQQIDAVRSELAAAVGCDPAELAITRNTTESMHIAQCGVPLRPGDEVLTTDQDYTRMLWAWDQRARRDGIVIRRIQFPVPASGPDLLQRFADAMTPRTRVVHFCHVTNPTGQLFPVRDICRLARERGIVSIVDGAQAVGHFPFAIRDLECDVYGSSLHKWLMAPHGTGVLYVRRERIEEIWPLMPALESERKDIRKFEEIGTGPAAAKIAIRDALAYQRTIGLERKAARLRELTLRWAAAIKDRPRVRLFSSLAPGDTWAMATFGIDGIGAAALVQHLRERHRILASASVNQGRPGPVLDYQGVRVTPGIYTTYAEVDRLVEAIDDVLRIGLPA